MIYNRNIDNSRE